MKENSVKLVARLGYAARGVVYLILGGLALLAALGGGGGQATDPKGALASILGEPMGFAILLAIGIGLFAYAAWRAVQALLDADHHGADAKGLVIRGAMLVSAVTHTSLAVYAVTLPFALGAFSGGGNGSRDAAAWVLRQPFGRYLLAMVAVAIIGAGLAQIWKGVSGGYRQRFAMAPDLLDKLSPICGLGLVARGAVFLIVGGFFAYAAWVIDPNEAGGTAAALHWARSQDYGRWLFLAIAIGLLAFGLYGLIQARWRRIDLDEPIRQKAELKAAGKRLGSGA